MLEDPVKSVYDLIARQYGAKVAIEDPTTNLSIGTSDLIILQNNPRRLSFVIINLSANVIYVRPRNVSSATTGIRLAPTGGSLAVNWSEDLHLPALEWHALASGATSAIYITSVVLI